MECGVRQAAEKLGVSHSTISRYIDKYPELNVAPPGSRKKVNLDQLRRHREDNLTVQEQGQPLLASPPEAPAPEKRGGEKDDHAVASRRRQSEARATYEETRAELAALDLRQKRGELIDVEIVRLAFADTGALLQNRLASRRRDMAERLVAIEDVREAEAFLQDADRELLEAFRQNLINAANAAEEEATE
jgi:hypothetical protein